MILHQLGKTWSSWLVLCVVSVTGQPVARATLSAEKVVENAVARTQQLDAGAARANYTYTKVSVTERFDAEGKVREHKERTYQIRSEGGTIHAKLLEVNGHPPGEAELKKQAENEVGLRQLLGEGKSGKRENADSFLTPELAARFDYALIGQKQLNGRLAYEVTFQPKNPEPPMHRLVDHILNRISGTLWIDAQEFEIARADIQLRSEVDLLGGTIGCLKKLDYTMTRTRVADGLWLRSSSSGDIEGRKLLDSMRIKTKSQCTNFHPLA